MLHILETTSARSIKAGREMCDLFLKYRAEFYSCLAYARAQKLESLQNALRANVTHDFAFQDWCRVVRAKWNLLPLSAKGSLLDPAGGRFNIGGLDGTRFPSFPALYAAEDSATALCEVFGKEETRCMSRLEYALAGADSFSCYRLQGVLETVLDLTEPGRLSSYFDLIKTIKFPKYVIAAARVLGLPKPRTVKTCSELFKTLFEKNWRYYPMQCDIPANSQILGQIAESAGIQAILYRSHKGMKRNLAIFPKNFANSFSVVELMDETPKNAQVVRRIDQSTYSLLV